MITQNYGNHSRIDPKYHYFLLPLCLVLFVMSILHLRHSHQPADVLLVPVTFALFFLSSIARVYAMKVQDRVIRLEETLRLRTLGFDPARLTMRQMIALRFASDEEAPALAARAAAESLTSKQIKEAVVIWRPDLDRV